MPGGLLLAASCAPAPPADAEQALARGLVAIARGYDGATFDDPYLKFTYADERLEELPGRRVTYRLLDAYFIVELLAASGVEPGPARELFTHADEVTSELAAVWRGRGIYNLRRHGDPHGIALDTYAILAYLRRDAALARVVAAGLDGDGWMPAGFYRGREAFRLLADESWAVRALAVTGVD
ncbi:MAG TPA: hypothetical protein VJS92_14695, partial [Candidatus Polarisedimenticolaceae bacterium]|nr:hypothetical protein [Candidatus Polarisedimenticolaceae bacterium]